MQSLMKIHENWKKPNPFRKRLIFFEGLDKTGKTSLCRKVRFEGGHTIACYDRGFVGRKVFCKFRGETDFPLADWDHLEEQLIRADAYAVVWLRCELSTIVRRHFQAGELCEFTLDEFNKQELLYAEHIDRLRFLNVPVLELWTDKEHDEHLCVRQILGWAGVL